jgi:hypothetical protein
MRILTIIFSTLTFTFFFLLLTLVLRFWGHCILKVVRVEVSPNNITLPLAAGLALMTFLAVAFYPYTVNYNLFFFSFYLIGLIGSFIGFFYSIKNILSSYNRKAALTTLFKCDSFIVIIILSIFISFLYSVIWPSGKIEVYFNYNYDYFSWIFVAEYLTGGINPKILDLNPFFFQSINDAFGTYTIISAIATANLKTPLLGAPIIGLTLLVWTAEAMYCLLQKSFGFKPWLTLILTLGVALSSLFNYIAIIGMFGHMVFLLTFLICFELLCHDSNLNTNGTSLYRRLFFPLFLLFISYQAGYILLICFISLFGALLFFFQCDNRSLFPKLAYSAIMGFWPVTLITIFCSLFAPGIFLHLSQRALEVAAQTAGWGLPFFSPWHFSGLPYYSQKAFQPIISQVFWRDVSVYIPLIILISIFLFLILIQNKSKRPIISDTNIKPVSRTGVITALSLTYLTALVVFLAFSLYYGTYYKIWKFAAYAVLPLSFIPTALFFKALERLCPNISSILITIPVIIVIIIFKFFSMPNFIEIPHKYFTMILGSTFINSEQLIKTNLPKSSLLFIDFDFYDELWVSSIILNSQKFYKINYLHSLPFLNSNIINFNTFNKNSFIISSFKYNNLIKSTSNNIDSGSIYIYGYDTILNQGMAYFSNGLSPYDWEVSNYPIHASFLIPRAKRGQELKLRIDISAPNTPICQPKARLGIFHKDKIIWEEKELDQLWAIVPAELTIAGTLYAHLILPQPSEIDASCLYKINSFTLD